MNASILTLAILLNTPAAPAAPAAPVEPADGALKSAVDQKTAPAMDPARQSGIVRAHTDQLIAAFKRVKEDDGKLTATDKATNAKAYTELDELLDRDYFTTISIKPRNEKFSAADLATFKSMFWDVVQRIAYPGSGEFFREGQVKFGTPTQKGDLWTIELTAYIPSEDLETVVGLQWRGGEKMRIVDVLFDGDSLVRDYQNQFGRIVDKDGSAGLLKALTEKRDELKKKAVPAP